MRQVAGPNVPGERLGASECGVAIFLLAGHLVRFQIADAQFGHLIGLQGVVTVASSTVVPVSFMPAVLRVVSPEIFPRARIRARVRDTRPVPVRGCGAVRQLIVQHFAHAIDHRAVPRISVITQGTIHKHRVQTGRVVRPIRAVQRRGVKGGIRQICLQTIGLHGHFVANELRSQPDDVVVCALLRLNPRKQLTLRIE